jgi:hypothetical protein
MPLCVRDVKEVSTFTNSIIICINFMLLLYIVFDKNVPIPIKEVEGVVKG